MNKVNMMERKRLFSLEKCGEQALRKQKNLDNYNESLTMRFSPLFEDGSVLPLFL